MTDLFNQFSWEFLGPLEHLGRPIDVIYVGHITTSMEDSRKRA